MRSIVPCGLNDAKHKNSDSFKSTQRLIQSQEKFNKRARKSLPKELLNHAQNIKSDQELREFVSKAIEEAQTGKGDLGVRRLHGMRRTGKELEDLQVNFARFLASYSGIVDLVKTSGGQYGSFAYGTLSLVLAVSLSWCTRHRYLKLKCD
jgi:hypothetical protein